MDATQIAERIVTRFLVPALDFTGGLHWHELSRETGRAAAYFLGRADQWAEDEQRPRGEFTDLVLPAITNAYAGVIQERGEKLTDAGPEKVLSWFVERVRREAGR